MGGFGIPCALASSEVQTPYTTEELGSRPGDTTRQVGSIGGCIYHVRHLAAFKVIPNFISVVRCCVCVCDAAVASLTHRITTRTRCPSRGLHGVELLNDLRACSCSKNLKCFYSTSNNNYVLCM